MGMQVNKKQLAEFFGISERSFTDYQRDPSFPILVNAKRGAANTYDTADVHAWLLERAATKGRETNRERLDRIRGDREELAHASDLKEAIPADETFDLIEEAIVASRNVMLHGNAGLKKRIDREYKIDLDIEILNAHSHEVLTHVSELGEKFALENAEGLAEVDAT